MSNNIVQPTTVEREIAGVRISLSTGQMARQAQGSVICTIGDSSAYAAVCSATPRFEPSFFPLTCDYREKTQAAGKIPVDVNALNVDLMSLSAHKLYGPKV